MFQYTENYKKGGRMNKSAQKMLSAVLFFLLAFTPAAYPCTGISIVAKDGKQIAKTKAF